MCILPAFTLAELFLSFLVVPCHWSALFFQFTRVRLSSASIQPFAAAAVQLSNAVPGNRVVSSYDVFHRLQSPAAGRRRRHAPPRTAHDDDESRRDDTIDRRLGLDGSADEMDRRPTAEQMQQQQAYYQQQQQQQLQQPYQSQPLQHLLPHQPAAVTSTRPQRAAVRPPPSPESSEEDDDDADEDDEVNDDEDDDDDEHGGGGGDDDRASQMSAALAKKSRITQACDSCRRRKRKCDGTQPICSSCDKLKLQCSYQTTVKKRGPQAGVVKRLRQEIQQLETELQVKASAQTARMHQLRARAT
jgi:hypothetical protein